MNTPRTRAIESYRIGVLKGLLTAYLPPEKLGPIWAITLLAPRSGDYAQLRRFALAQGDHTNIERELATLERSIDELIAMPGFVTGLIEAFRTIPVIRKELGVQ